MRRSRCPLLDAVGLQTPECVPARKAEEDGGECVRKVRREQNKMCGERRRKKIRSVSRNRESRGST